MTGNMRSSVGKVINDWYCNDYISSYRVIDGNTGEVIVNQGDSVHPEVVDARALIYRIVALDLQGKLEVNCVRVVS